MIGGCSREMQEFDDYWLLDYNEKESKWYNVKLTNPSNIKERVG